MSCFHFQTEPLFLKFLNLLNVGLSHLYIEIQNNNRNAASCIHNKNVHFEVGSFLVLAFSVSTKIDPAALLSSLVLSCLKTSPGVHYISYGRGLPCAYGVCNRVEG